jgi:hypothetical protein
MSDRRNMTDRERYIEADRKAEARIALLRALVADRKCLNQDKTQFMTDCGECVICAFRHGDGAERFLEGRGIRATVPGAAEHRQLGDELWDGIIDMLARDSRLKQRIAS